MEREVIVLEKTCRTCMIQDKNDNFIPLFQGSSSCKYAHPEVLEEVLHFNLALWEHDGLPQQLCLSCVDTFIQICEFRKQCNAVQDNLSPYRIIIKPDNNEDTIENDETTYLATGAFDQYDSFLDVKDSIKDDIDENLTDELIEEDYSIDYEENRDFSPNIKYESLAFGTEHAKEHYEDNINVDNSTRNDEQNYPCTIEFELKEEVKESLPETDSTTDRPVCTVCSRTFKTVHGFNVHIARYHSSNETLECVPCNRIFKNVVCLKRHKQRVHTVIENECVICQKKFTSITSYKYHMKSHNPKKRFQCQYCDKSFMQIHHKENHERVHTGERPHQCTVCEKSFKCRQQLKTHIARHDKTIKRSQVFISPYQCNVCGKFLIRQQTLDAHMATHTNIRPVQCDQCDKTWRSKNALKMHKYREHGGPNTNENNSTGNRRDYPFCCSVCSKGFLVAHTLSEHMKIHSEDRQYICKLCGTAFKRKAHLKTHINQVHIKLLQFPCDLCDKKFVSKGELKGHRVTHYDEKPFKCTSCPFAFKWKNSLRVHERIHTGEKPFACGICDKRYANSQVLLYHSMCHTDAEKKIVADKILKELNMNQKEKEEIIEPFINVDS